MPDLQQLRGIFAGRLITDENDMAPFLVDWRERWRGRAIAIAQPDTPVDVAAVVGWCMQHTVPIVPQGGNTGMSGGAIADDSGMAIVLSLTRLDRIRTIDTIDNTITVDAGCPLRVIQDAADAENRLFPLRLAAEGSCTIGGNLATNAGGTAVLRYGNARDLCLGLEVVTARGDIWDGLRALRKDNSGYDLRDLFIGSEGTLGIITGAVLKLQTKPTGKATAWLAVASVDHALQLLVRARDRFDTALTGFEMISSTALDLVLRHVPGMRRPVDTIADIYVLLELSEFAGEALDDALATMLATAMEVGIVADAVVAQSARDAAALWALRENIGQAQSAAGPVIKHDISIPVSAIGRFLDDAGGAIRARWPDMRFVTFGHLGDGNLHYNFSAGKDDGQRAFFDQEPAINRVVHDLVAHHRGSVSAEHGLGVLRRDDAARYKSAVEIDLMRSIKRALDPQNLLNPGKVLAMDCAS